MGGFGKKFILINKLYIIALQSPGGMNFPEKPMKILSRLMLATCLAISVAHAAEAPASAPANASAPMALPGKEDVLKAIAVMDKDFLAPESGQAAQTVMRFAESSKEVAIQLNPKTTPWLFGETQGNEAGENYRMMLLVAYLAGNMKAQLTAGKAVDSPVPGWEFALKAYQAIQKSDGQFKLDELETLKKQQAKGELPKLAKQALQKP